MVEINKPINLGMGCPDFDAWPQSIMEAMADIVQNGSCLLHQYTKSPGHPRLVKVLGQLYSHLLGRTVNGDDNILITIGAYEALHCTIYGLVNTGDQVIIIDPAYDAYDMITKAAGGIPVHVALKRMDNRVNGENHSGWTLDFEELESKFNARTRFIIVNTPNNPLGKVYTKEELTKIADLCHKYNIIAIMDEVYEWLTYGSNEHFRLASLPGMFEKSITIGSLGKAFNVTGWRCGWAVTGNTKIREAMTLAHMSSVYVCPTPIQEAAARTFELELQKLRDNQIDDMYWTQLTSLLTKKRDMLFNMLSELGFNPMVPEGGYYLVADCRRLIDRLNLNDYFDKRGKTFSLVRWLSKHGVQGVPLTVFYRQENQHLAEGLVRFCFIKSDETLLKARDALIRMTQLVDNCDIDEQQHHNNSYIIEV
ncbi:kynurenine aminotransferase-like isoform X2 [Oppia nitens]|nr:kynurenine aminotransferase-like isoform X2 [Oppia nitens]